MGNQNKNTQTQNEIRTYRNSLLFLSRLEDLTQKRLQKIWSVRIEPDSSSMKMTNHRELMLLITRQLLTLVHTQNTALEKQKLSIPTAISTRPRRAKPQDTLTTPRLRTTAIAPTGRMAMESPKNLPTVWLKTACSITASGEEMSS